MVHENEQELLLLVGRIDGKLDLLLEHNEKFGTRLSGVESAQSRMTGIATALAAFSAWLGKDHLASLFGLGSNQ